MSAPVLPLPVFPTPFRRPMKPLSCLTFFIAGVAVTLAAPPTDREAKAHWSFQPLSQPAVPANSTPANAPASAPAPAAAANPIDAFIAAKLSENGLTFSPPADPVTWLRRVTLDLTGLPPTPEETEQFLTEKSREAVVDRLLASPRHGERQAQHWLDVVRYADTHGFEVNTERPRAWPYRDYVIDAFNRDLPYDQFIRSQIAGDQSGEPAATGFLVTASLLLPDQTGQDEPSKRLARQDAIDEIVVNIGQTFLGLGIGCARCHDHKFDPVTARDYYAMQAFVAGVEYGELDLDPAQAQAARAEAERLRPELAELDRALSVLVPLAKSGHPRPAINARENVDRFPPVKARRLRFTIKSTNSLEPCLDELQVFDSNGKNIAAAAVGARTTSGGDTEVPGRHSRRFLNDGVPGNSSSWMSSTPGKGWVEIEFAEECTIDRVNWGRDGEGKFTDRLATDYQIEIQPADSAAPWQIVADAADRQASGDGNPPAPAAASGRANAAAATASPLDGLTDSEKTRATTLRARKKELEKRLSAAANPPRVFAGTSRQPDDIRLLYRGDPEQPRERVGPAIPAVLGDLRLPDNLDEPTRRRHLADWIADPANPLTARVMVNRIWQGHFGTGLVSTPSDFGRMGMKPTHPELLDWLSAEFIRGGWSVKRLHRLIVLSAAYGQSSQINPAAAAVDADVRLLWRYPNRRLDAESLRDSMLSVSGTLNPAMHGPGFNLFSQRGGLSGFAPVEKFGPENQRRMIYAHKVRREPESVFGAFDCPDAGQSTAVRRVSTTPIQALNLFNSPFTLTHAAAFAERVRRECGDDASAGIRRAWLLALSRPPTAAELEDSLPVVAEHGLAVLCRALLNCNEFLFLP